jgi:hypothetical protein
MKRVPLLMLLVTILAAAYAFALPGCGLSGVQKVKLACAESAERLAAAYRAPGAALPQLDAQTAARGALCNEATYRQVQSGARDAGQLVTQIQGGK